MEELKEKIEEIVKKLTENKDLLDDFKKNPIKVVEKLIGIDLPDEKLEAIVEGIKAKLAIYDIGDVADKLGLDDVLGKLGGLFGKKN